jgi:hypothetical protein
MGLSKIRKRFFNFTFFFGGGGAFYRYEKFAFLNQHKILDFFIPYVTYFKKKKTSPPRRAVFQIFQHKSTHHVLGHAA